jgi:transposase
VVLDNVGYHKAHAARRWWVTHQDRIRPLWQPAYSPELNLMEWVWRYLKARLACYRDPTGPHRGALPPARGYYPLAGPKLLRSCLG